MLNVESGALVVDMPSVNVVVVLSVVGCASEVGALSALARQIAARLPAQNSSGPRNIFN